MSTGLNDPGRCQWCGSFHQAKCPLVKKLTYRDNGTIQCVEFFAPNDYAPITAAGSLPVILADGPVTTRGSS